MGLDLTRRLAGQMMVKVRGNAKRRGIEVSITVEDIDRMMRDQDMRCCLTGIKFKTDRHEGCGRVRPRLPSVDRIDARGPYAMGNVRIVCAAMNAALGDWGEDSFERMLDGYCRAKGWMLLKAVRKPKAERPAYGTALQVDAENASDIRESE